MTDDELTDAMINVYWKPPFDNEHSRRMRAVLAVARPIIERETRRVAMEEAANIVRTQPCLGAELHNRAALIAIFEAEASE